MMKPKALTVLTLLLLSTLLLSAGCFEEYKAPAMDMISTVVVVKGSTQYCQQYPEECNPVTPDTTVAITYTVTETPTPSPTPVPTVTVEPTSIYRTIDPFAGGERWQGQWYIWTWPDVSGLQDANRGIVVYGHSYHDTLTQWNDPLGNYVKIIPPTGFRFLAVYAHHEDFGPDDTGLWGYGPSNFKLQFESRLHDEYPNYNKTYRLIELESSHSDYYNIDRLKPYAINRIYKGYGYSKTGGYYAEELWTLRRGQGNSWDGYILYLVPVSITDSDIRIVANFAGKDVNWRFDRNDVIYHI